MTRGTLYLLLPDGFLRSTEFNGDMYPEGYGDLAMESLSGVSDAESFGSAVLEFNRKTHGYQDETMVFSGSWDEIAPNLDMTGRKYFGFWFSDWIFVKNSSGADVSFGVRTEGGARRNKPFVLKNGHCARFYFGKPYREGGKNSG